MAASDNTSPGLLQERYAGDGWRVLVTCIFLNQTARRQVEPVLEAFFARWPSAEDAAQAEIDEVEVLLRPLGLSKARARNLVAMSRAFVAGGWMSPLELPGIGRYGADAWAIFVEGDIDIEPADHALRRYVEWARAVRDEA
jgi:methyl-CpG-binding domain protein 4